MVEKTMELKRGGSICEEDVSDIFQRYTATTVLTLLQEVAQIEDVNIDWKALVKQTKTGITNPREYQMLWRHLAYRNSLIEKLEDDAEPVDDDSDLEYELEAFPTVSNEASAEAAACVKVLIASGLPSDSCLEKGLTIEAPLTINIPKVNKLTRYPSQNPQISSNGVNITIPVSVPTQILPTVEGLDTNGCANSNLPPRRKRKAWSAAEDNELFAAVQKCGEGNWANILKGDFKGDRTASQLSQRWNIIKKRKTNTKTKMGSQLSEVQLAARRALNMALDKPGADNPKAASSLGKTNPGNISAPPTVADPPSSTTTLPKNHTQQDSAPTGAKISFPRTQPFPARPLLNPGADAVKAAAVAAGARIATQSAAAAILKAQLKSAIHIKTTPTGNPRPSPATGAHVGPDYFRDRFSGISPNPIRPNLGLGNANANVCQVVQSNQSTGPDVIAPSETTNIVEVKPPGGSANSPVDPIKVAVSGDPQRDVVKDDQVKELGSKDHDREEQPPTSGDPPNNNLESERQ